MIQYSRIQGGTNNELFGSSIKSNNKISLSIHTASVERDLNRDCYFPKNTIIEILMTPNQFSEFITSPNTSGVPCTIIFKDGKRIEGRKFESKRATFEQEIKESLSDLINRTKTFQNKVDDLLNKPNVTKKDKEELRNQAMMIEQEIRANLPFIQQSFNESMDKTVVEVKSEFEASIDHKLYSLGLEALKENINTQLLDK